MIMHFLLSLLGILLTILIVVGIHEGAHFLAARSFGIKVLRCSIGFGRALFRWHDKKGTEYVIAAIPLGGYVKLLDETETPVAAAEKHLAFNRQSLYKRFTVVVAGPIANLVLAVILYWIILMIGFKTAIPLIGAIEAHSIADSAGLKPQQEIIRVDQHLTQSWSSVTLRLITHMGDNDTALITVKPIAKNSSAPAESYLLNLDGWQLNALRPDPLSSLGITPYFPQIPLVIGEISQNSPAANAPLQVGDKLVALNKQTIKSWDTLMSFIIHHPDETISLTIKRHQQTLNLKLTLGHQRNLFLQKQGFLGIRPQFDFPQELLHTIQYGPLAAGYFAVKETRDLSYLNILLFWKLLTHKLSVLSLSGPITIFENAGSAFQSGGLAFLSFLAFLNVALGIVNLLPVPGLDGGHLLFQLIELILKRPLALSVQILCYRLGFILLFFLLIQALANDLLRLWQ